MTQPMPKRWTRTELQRHESPGCPSCGRRVFEVWIDATEWSDPEPMFVLGRWKCETVGCKYGPRA